MKRSSRRKKKFIVLKQTNDADKINNFFMNRYCARRKLVEHRDLILELTGKIQALQNEINCMNDSRHFQDAESVRSGHSHVTSQLVSFPPHPIPGGMLSRSIGMPSRNDRPPSIWDTHVLSGNVFCKSSRVFFRTLSAGIESMGSHMSEPIHSSQAVKNEKQTPAQDQRCQSGPSAKNSIISSEGGFFKELWGRLTTTADFRSSFRQIHHTSNILLVGR